MQFYRTTGVLNVPAGFKLALNDLQINGRERNLILKLKGKCEVKSPIQFKAGETVGIEKPDKVMLKVLEEVKDEKVDAKA
jgi:hypothetical protein